MTVPCDVRAATVEVAGKFSQNSLSEAHERAEWQSSPMWGGATVEVAGKFSRNSLSDAHVRM